LFAASVFLTGLFAIGIPVAIHILARQKKRKILWGAMPFLHESISSASSRKNRLKDWLLLLLRTLAILFLVLTFAQPLMSRLSMGGSDLETIFVWDVSLSTMMLDEESKPVHESLRESLLDEIDQLPDRSRVRILLAGAELRWMRDEVLELTEVNRLALQAAIREQTIDQGGSQLASAILTALSQSESDSVKSRQLVVLHDSRRQAWQDEEEGLWKTIRQRLAGDQNLSLRVLPPAVEIAPEPLQLSINDLNSDRDTIALKTPGRFRASLKNHSSTQSQQARVTWLIDGRSVEQSPVMTIPPQVEQKLEQLLRFDTPGSHQVSCELEFSDDILREDNSASMVVEVLKGLPILVVDDTVRTQRGQILPSEFLSASLGKLKETKQTKHANKESGKESLLFDPQAITSGLLDPSVVEGSLAVVIAKADSLPGGSAEMLRNYVEGGGGLWIMMDTTGEKIPEWIPGLLRELGLEALGETKRIKAESVDNAMKIMASNPEGEFANGMAADRLDLFRAELGAVHELQRPVYLEEECLLETDQGIPVLLSLGVGAGKVILQTTDLNRQNTNWPLLQSFVPFVREVIRDATQGTMPRRNLDPGEAIQMPLLRMKNSGGSKMLKDPGGEEVELEQRGNWFELAETVQPGIYQQPPNDLGATQDSVELFSIRRPAAESDLTPILAEEIASFTKSSGASEATASQEIFEGRWTLAWHLAILTGVLFIAESLLAHFISRGLEASSDGIELKPVF